MTTRARLLVSCVFACAVAAACGSSSSPSVDGGGGADGSAAADGGNTVDSGGASTGSFGCTAHTASMGTQCFKSFYTTAAQRTSLENTCTTNGGTVSPTCSTVNLLGCCSSALLTGCSYSDSGKTAAEAMTACTNTGGTWSTTP